MRSGNFYGVRISSLSYAFAQFDLAHLHPIQQNFNQIRIRSVLYYRWSDINHFSPRHLQYGVNYFQWPSHIRPAFQISTDNLRDGGTHHFRSSGQPDAVDFKFPLPEVEWMDPEMWYCPAFLVEQDPTLGQYLYFGHHMIFARRNHYNGPMEMISYVPATPPNTVRSETMDNPFFIMLAGASRPALFGTIHPDATPYSYSMYGAPPSVSGRGNTQNFGYSSQNYATRYGTTSQYEQSNHGYSAQNHAARYSATSQYGRIFHGYTSQNSAARYPVTSQYGRNNHEYSSQNHAAQYSTNSQYGRNNHEYTSQNHAVQYSTTSQYGRNNHEYTSQNHAAQYSTTSQYGQNNQNPVYPPTLSQTNTAQQPSQNTNQPSTWNLFGLLPFSIYNSTTSDVRNAIAPPLSPTGLHVLRRQDQQVQQSNPSSSHQTESNFDYLSNLYGIFYAF